MAPRRALRQRLLQQTHVITVLNELGFALASETDAQRLLQTILTFARELLQADAGTLYLREGQRLRFAAIQNETVTIPYLDQELPINEESLAGYVASRNRMLRIDDAQRIPPEEPFHFSPQLDRQLHYRTRSMLLVPLRDASQEVIGVLALVNRKRTLGQPIKDFDREVLPFSASQGPLALSIASQASLALRNHRMVSQIKKLLDGFVQASITAIEARDPSTGGHSNRVAELTYLLAREVDACEDGALAGVRFSEQQLTEIRYAALLHDFGKIGIREQVLLKSHKLYPWEMEEIELRCRLGLLQQRLRYGQGEGFDLPALEARLRRDLAEIHRLNDPQTLFLPIDQARLEEISHRWALQEEDEPALKPIHTHRLSIRRGSLDDAEFAEIKQHVVYTQQFLSCIPWTPELAGVPAIAGCHHEKLDGSGYPKRLKREQIPFGAQLLTIVDIFDALVSPDRPYKPGHSVESALSILREEASAGRVHKEGVELLAARRLWTRIRSHKP